MQRTIERNPLRTSTFFNLTFFIPKPYARAFAFLAVRPSGEGQKTSEPIAKYSLDAYCESDRSPLCCWRPSSLLPPRLNLLFYKLLMKFLIPVISIALGSSSSLLHAEPVSLFNGKDLSGWIVISKVSDGSGPLTFSVRDNVISCTGSPKGFIKSEKSYSRYTLTYDWRFERPEGLEKESDFKGNSGCLIHISEGKGIAIWPRSLEVQGRNNEAGLFLPIPRNLKGELSYDKKAHAKAVKPLGEWNSFEIKVDGGNITVALNGVPVSECKDSELTSGPIALQSEGAQIHFRNIQITEESSD